MNPSWHLDLATAADIPALEDLIPRSARELQAAHYSPAQIEAALGPVFGVDRQLIADRTYFVARADAVVVAGGGWSRRRSVFGGSDARTEEDPVLDPASEPARIRAFFVHPQWARQGIGRALLTACESAIQAAGYREITMVATLAGEPLYAASGYQVMERFAIPLGRDLSIPAVRMGKAISC